MSDINEKTLQSAVEKVQQLNPDKHRYIISKVCDVSREEQVAALIEYADSTWSEGVDIVFNNAGIMHPADDNALTTEDKIWDLTHNISMNGFRAQYMII